MKHMFELFTSRIEQQEKRILSLKEENDLLKKQASPGA
jgi:hypothetical protein